jgi:hypothetical protein
MQFVLEKEQDFSNIDDALKSLSNEYVHEKLPLNLGDLRLNDNYDFVINDTLYKPTEWAFENLLKALDIPVRFGKKVPNDLLKIIVHRLEQEAEKEDKDQVVMAIQGREVWNIMKKDHKINLSEIIQTVCKTKNPFKVKLGVRGVIIDTETLLGTAEPVVGDVVRIGTRTVASETGGPKPMSNLLMYRLVCKNGAVASSNYGQLKWGRSGDYTINDFALDSAILDSRATFLTEALKRLPSQKLNDMTFHYVWNSVRKVMNDNDESDKLLSVTEDERDTYIASAKRRSERRLAAGPTEVNAWDAYNKVSEYARDLKYRENDNLARVAGHIVDSVSVPDNG